MKKSIVALAGLVTISAAFAGWSMVQDVVIVVDPTTTHQTMKGWEVSGYLWEQNKKEDRYDPSWQDYWAEIFNRLVNELGVNRVRIEVRSGAENPVDHWTAFEKGKIGYNEVKRFRYQTINDDDDPKAVNKAGFQFSELDRQVAKIALPLKRLVEANGERLFIGAQCFVRSICFPAVYSYFPIFTRVPCVVCYHDATGERLPELLFPTKLNHRLWQLKTALARFQTTRAMTVSQASATDLEQILRILAGRIDVVTEAADPIFRTIDDSSVVAEARSRYNVPEGATLLVWYIDDTALVELLNGAAALVFPSLWEGFGLPAVEAMSCGVPVLASRRGSLPEVIGDAGLFFEPESPSAIAECVMSFLGNPELRPQLRGVALKRAEIFTWDRAAELAEICFRRCYEDGRR